MSDWSPPTLSIGVIAVVAACWLVVLAYAVLALGNPMLGLAPGLLLVVGYFAWRLLVAVEGIAAGLHRLAAACEGAERDEPTR